MRSYCRVCKTIESIVSYKKDDPVLSCGHIKTLSKEHDDKIEECRRQLDIIISRAVQHTGRKAGYIKADIVNSILNDDQVGYCPICEDLVALIQNKDGHLICAGNYISNPGCGCSVRIAVAVSN